jgi:hypothetical protein
MCISQKHCGTLLQHAPILRTREIYFIICKKVFVLEVNIKQNNYIQVQSVCLSVYLSIYLWLYSLLLGLGHFSVFNPIHSRQNSLDGGSARRKGATYTQNNTNTE